MKEPDELTVNLLINQTVPQNKIMGNAPNNKKPVKPYTEYTLAAIK